jgi:hypothetical protein
LQAKTAEVTELRKKLSKFAPQEEIPSADVKIDTFLGYIYLMDLLNYNLHLKFNAWSNGQITLCSEVQGLQLFPALKWPAKLQPWVIFLGVDHPGYEASCSGSSIGAQRTAQRCLHSVSSSILPRHSPYHPFGRGWHRLQHSHIEAFRSWVWSSKN